jgi:hypothetical protein
MPIDAPAAQNAFRDAQYSLRRVADFRQIGSGDVLNEVQRAIRNFGMGVEGMWTQTARNPSSVPSAAAHDLLLDLKNLGVFEGAARVAKQRSGYMDIPREQYDMLRTAYDHAGKAVDLLRKVDNGGFPADKAA